MIALLLELMDATWLFAAKVAVVVAVTDFVGRILFRSSAAARHLCWTLCCMGILVVLVGGIVPPAWTVPMPDAARFAPPSAPEQMSSPETELSRPHVCF